MAPTTFPQFGRLPAELRLIIYSLATPSRVVRLQEETKEDRDTFIERFRTTVTPLKLDPSLTYFAKGWRDGVSELPLPFQRTLEDFGFTGPQRHQPWPPSAWCPEIRLEMLQSEPSLAWEMVREGSFYSTALIPGLLHTCTESRRELMQKGYQLAFRTRTQGPRTWFNYERDILYLDHTDEVEDGYLCQTWWNMGQLHPIDLMHVRRLALPTVGHVLGDVYKHAEGYTYSSMDTAVPASQPFPQMDTVFPASQPFTAALRLFRHLDELLLVDRHSYLEQGPENPSKYDADRAHKKSCRVVTAHDIDPWLKLLSNGSYDVENMPSAHTLHYFIHGDDTHDRPRHGYYKDSIAGLQNELAAEKHHLLKSLHKHDTVSAVPWKIPTVRVAHILSPSDYEDILEERRRGWSAIQRILRSAAEEERRRKASPVSNGQYMGTSASARFLEGIQKPSNETID